MSEKPEIRQKMKYYLVPCWGKNPDIVFAKFAVTLDKVLAEGWRISPGTYYSVASESQPPLPRFLPRPAKTKSTKVFMICVQVEREERTREDGDNL